jgi:hypothetical protein
MSMFSCHFEGVHLHTLTTYRVLMPSTPGPGGEWVVHFSSWPSAPLSSPVREDLPADEWGPRGGRGGRAGLEPVHDALVFATPKARDAWWSVMNKQLSIQWTEITDEFAEGK